MHTSLPMLVIISGPPGSGKSTLAARLSQHLGIPHCARDTIKQGQVWHRATHLGVAHDAHAACNRAFHDIVALSLRHGISLVCDAAFQHQGWQSFLATWQTQAHIRVLACHVDESLRRQRLLQRLHNEPQRHAAHDDQAYLADFSQHPPFHALHTTHPTLVVATHTPDYAPSFETLCAWVREHAL